MSLPAGGQRGRWWVVVRNALSTLAGSNQATAAPPPIDASLPQSPILQPTALVNARGHVPLLPPLSLPAPADPPQSLVALASASDMNGPYCELLPSHFAPSPHSVLALRGRRNSCSNIGADRRPRSRERRAHTPHPYARSPRSEDDASDAKSPLSPSTRDSSRGRSRRGSSRSGALSQRSATSPVFAPGAQEDELNVFDTYYSQSQQLDTLSPRAVPASSLSAQPPPD